MVALSSSNSLFLGSGDTAMGIVVMREYDYLTTIDQGTRSLPVQSIKNGHKEHSQRMESMIILEFKSLTYRYVRYVLTGM